MPGADTIVALATASGQAGIGVVRVSGPDATAIMAAVCGRTFPPRTASLARFRDGRGQTLDQGIALFFPAPRSYTGEDVLELQAHGGPVLLKLLVERCLELGARLAEPGEFTRRAFLNDKLDLAQAEAVADLIGASTEQAARSAARSLEGEFSVRVRSFQERLTALRAYVEATLDFPEEDIDSVEQGRLAADLRALQQSIAGVLQTARQGSLLREGLRVALVGPPNVGKSSIINVLSNEDVAIVTPVPGTTRDLVRQTVVIEGVPVHIVDTAGVRRAEDPIEQIGIDRAWAAVATADVILVVADASAAEIQSTEEIEARLPPGRSVIHVHNKIDLAGRLPGLETATGQTHVWMSALSKAGLDLLRQAIVGTRDWSGAGEGVFMARVRHVDALARCRGRIDAALATFRDAELVAEELRQAQLALSEITGEYAADDLLGEIFSRFCIGK